jgi:hypothetical protein
MYGTGRWTGVHVHERYAADKGPEDPKDSRLVSSSPGPERGGKHQNARVNQAGERCKESDTQRDYILCVAPVRKFFHSICHQFSGTCTFVNIYHVKTTARMAGMQATEPSVHGAGGGVVAGATPLIGGEDADIAPMPEPNSSTQLQIDASRPNEPFWISILTHHSQTMGPM